MSRPTRPPLTGADALDPVAVVGPVAGDTVVPRHDLPPEAGARPGRLPGPLGLISPLWLGIVELAIAMATIASGILATRVVTEALPPMTASVVRYAIGTLLLLPFMLRRDGWPRLSRRAWLIIAGVSMGGTLVFNAGLLYGLRTASVVEAGIMTSTTPMLVGVFGWLLFRERLSRRSWAAIALATAGVGLIIVRPGDPAPDDVSTWLRLGGLALILMGVAGEACFNVFGRRIPREVSSLTASTMTMAIGVGLFLPFALGELVTGGPPPLREAAWWAVVYHAVVPTVIGLLVWADGVRRVSLAVSGATTALIPVFTTIFAVAFLGEHLDATEVAGMLLVIVAVVALARWSARRPRGAGDRGEH